MSQSASRKTAKDSTRTPGRWLGNLQLEDVRPLGEGGHGEVFAATLVSAEGISQQVVLKMASGQSRAEVEMSRQFLLQEARLTASFDHPNIIAFRDYNVVETVAGEKVPCLVLEHGGVPLSAVIQSHGGRLDPGLAAFVAVEVLSALAYSHARGVIHRDVKPQNVLVGPHGQVRLIDYGIAKAADPRNPSTVVTNVKGTPVYISPEAYKGEKLDGRADIWTVGVMLFEMVIGRKPWEDDASEPNPMVRLRRISDLVMSAPLPTLPDELVPKDLAEVIIKMLMKQRDDRYEDALQAMYALEKVAVRLVGPWAAARELGQQTLAAADPIARRRRPSVDDSTVNVRADRSSQEKEEYVSMIVRWNDAASMVVPTELLEDDASDVVTYEGKASRTRVESLDVTAQMNLPPPRRGLGGFVKYAVIAATIAVAAVGAIISSNQGAAASKVGGGLGARSATAAAQPPVERPGVVSASPQLALEGAAMRAEPKGDVPASGLGSAPEKAPESPRKLHESAPAVNSERVGVGDIEVVLIPRGSFVSLDGRAPVKAPVAFHKVRPGNHQLRVGLSEGALDRTEKVRVKAGEVARVQVELANPFGD